MLTLTLTFLLLLLSTVNGADTQASDPSLPSEAQNPQAERSASRLPSLLRRLIPSGSTFKTVLLTVLALSKVGMSARLCQDHRVPVQTIQAFSFCTDYSGQEACLAPIESQIPSRLYPSEATVAQEFDKIAFGDHAGPCPELVQRLMCAKAADAWSSSLAPNDDSLIPYICPAMSSMIWQQCSNVEMTPNPFDISVNESSGGSTKLSQLFANQDEFSKAFYGGGDDDDNCYSGVPVDQTKPIPNLPLTSNSRYLGQVCLQRQKFPVGQKQFLLGGAPYPTDCDLMAIIDKVGTVSIWNMASSEIVLPQWLDLSKSVASFDASGLLSLVFHKDFAQNGRLFVSFNCHKDADGCDKEGDLFIDEYYVVDPIELTTPIFSKRLLVVGGVFRSDIGGQLLFSPSDYDPNLFVFLGDGGQRDSDDIGDPFNFAQDLSTLHGKVLRIDVDGDAPYTVPEDNPFPNDEGIRGEIYAYGLKNPWRCAFDRLQPEFLFCGDVGQHLYEEVNRIIAGGNYGWRYFEGRHVYNGSDGIFNSPIVFPQIEYRHGKPGSQAAIIGGYVYRPKHRSTIDGTYFFADEFGKLYSAIAVRGSGVYRLTPAAGQWVCAPDSPVPCGNSIGLVFSFFETQNGEVFVSTSNAIFKIVDPERCNLN